MGSAKLYSASCELGMKLGSMREVDLLGGCGFTRGGRKGRRCGAERDKGSDPHQLWRTHSSTGSAADGK